MHGWSVVYGLSIACVLACGGQAEGRDGSGGGFAEAGQKPAAGAGGARASGGSSGLAGRGGAGVAGEYVEPMCPEVEPPPPITECDPLEQLSSCPAGAACYPYVEHPFGRGCGVATLGAVCVREGTGVQGDVCGQGTPGCAARHLCVVGSRSGRRCARICQLDGSDDCPAGMICGETDVQGYGVCN